ncbi:MULTISPECIES: hypothetical protein [unclassified Sphingopyxis]|uniref:hypothetical protein n=1 Tax=unclassified Sphingopyxis TaxID=2614943 RepID=UPI0028553E74|nr:MULTISPECIES: hypothetical protein [unclassified Sphingopyxis]MDR7062009.1 hypothetical protein [Sphingopyxis sp. BE235]MDR7182467.1 hypothetical protein [Sphingopyxis sp. BE249]
MTDLRVFSRHMRSAQLCMPGARRWFAAHGLDWSDFVTNGIPATVLGQWGDPLAARAIEQARAEETNDGR